MPRSNALACPLRHPSAIGCDIGSGKISSSPFSTPSKIAAATDAGDAFGMSRSRDMSVSTGPAKTACTSMPRPANRARCDCVSENIAALDTEYAGMTGTGANAARDTTLTTAPRDRVSIGRKACVAAYVPKRLTARC